MLHNPFSRQASFLSICVRLGLTLALLAAALGVLPVPVAYAGDLAEVEPNDSLATAQNIDGGPWDLNFDPDIGDASTNTSTTIPHVSILGTGNNTWDWYEFTVADAGDRGIFDIDYGYEFGWMDSWLELYDSGGGQLAVNDDSPPDWGQGGSTAVLDSFIDYTFPAPGTYYIRVGRYPGGEVLSGATYELQVSVGPAGGGPPPTSYTSCLDILNDGASTGDGVYAIDPDGPFGSAPASVYCDMATDGGGWTLVGSTRDQTLNDQASTYYPDLTTLSPAAGHEGIWDGMRPVASGDTDIRFSCRNNAYSGPFSVDLAFYAINWYEEITASPSDASVCFEENDGSGDTQPPPARQNLLTGVTLPQGDQWNSGYLEGEDFCDSTDDFTVDFDDRGMDIDPIDGTGWGEDDTWRKCGLHQDVDGTWFVWVRELSNNPPVADAGTDQSVDTNALVTLDGSASDDPDGDTPLTYGWTQTGGTAVVLSSYTVSQPAFTAPGSPDILTFTLTVTDSLGLADPTPDEVMITVNNQAPIAHAGSDQGVSTSALVTLDGSASYDPDGDTPLTYGWTQTGGTTVVLSSYTASQPTFAAPGSPDILTFTLTVTDSLGLADPTPDEVVITVTTYRIYLSLVFKHHAVAPDLVVDSLTATSDGVQVVVVNQGSAPVTDEFWVDVYIDPDPAPTAVNQIWEDLADQGLVWGVTSAALPLEPGDVITLAVGDDYYVADYSHVTWPLPEGTPVYAQVDSANLDTTCGGVLENHEIVGGAYNNVSHTVSTAGIVGVAAPPAEGASRPALTSNLPPRR
jgi:hypothetical protein